jgi:hypothetical protein
MKKDLDEANLAGDKLEALRKQSEMAEFVQRNNINPLKQLVGPMCQVRAISF